MIVPNLLKNQGLICFEEITDYSILSDQKQKQKRKNTSEDDVKIVKKKKVEAPKQTDKKKLTKNKASDAVKAKKVKFSQNVKEVRFEKGQKVAAEPAKVTVADVGVDGTKSEAKTKKKKKKAKKGKAKNANPSNSTSRLSLHDAKVSSAKVDTAEIENKMSAWSDLTLPKKLLRGLYDKGFYEPTPIQKLVVPEAIKNKSNIIGTAQTGSGKTLAFGLPILSDLIDAYLTKDKSVINATAPFALIMTPTRELAIQIKDHLQACCKYQKTKIVVVVGGISQLKHERLLKKNPEIVVATPGRLMQLIEEGNEYLSNISQIKYLVIDEADRMIEKGHFGEMEKILALVNSDEKTKCRRQNLLFSATLITKFSGDFENLGKENRGGKKEKTDAQLKRERKAQLNALVAKIQMAKEPKLFDLTTKAVTAENLSESKIFCSINEKDIYLYYFLCKYTGRTLVFSNSIDCVRRLTNLFRLLKKTPLHLHANMNQKQRLKNLERFNADANSILIASDVASRGLDIPNVMHVIHYQVPRSAEIYVHRSGRTARSTNEGLSVMLVSPDELNLYRKILKTFKRENDMKDYPIELDFFDECKKRVSLAVKIDKMEHQTNKEKSNTNWFEKHAKLMDIDLDDEILKETYQDSEQVDKNKRSLQKLKMELKQQLGKMIFPKFMSRKYLQAGNVEKVMNINNLDSDHSALADLKRNKPNKQKKNKNKNN